MEGKEKERERASERDERERERGRMRERENDNLFDFRPRCLGWRNHVVASGATPSPPPTRISVFVSLLTSMLTAYLALTQP